MKKTFLLVAVLLAGLSIAGCSSPSSKAESQQAKMDNKEDRITLVSSANPPDVLPAFTYFTWDNEYNQVLSAEDYKGEEQFKAYIRREIIRYLETKGYVYQANPMQADVVLGFLVALKDDNANAGVQKRFGVLPRLHATKVNSPRYEQGTLMLNVLSADLKKVYWRSAMQGVTDLEKMQGDITSERIQSVLDIMMGNFPPAGR
jgi:hypothetical protein